MRYRTPLARVRGLGSARDGTHHWWSQRVTAIALIPLSLWLTASLLAMTDAGYAEFVAWLRSPLVAMAWIALLAALFHHAQLGVQVVIEDYVHTEWLKISCIVVTKLLAVVLAVICILCVLRVFLAS